MIADAKGQYRSPRGPVQQAVTLALGAQCHLSFPRQAGSQNMAALPPTSLKVKMKR